MSAVAPCPQCSGEKTFVIDSRRANKNVRRRRRCLDCSHRWTTYEVRVELIQLPEMVERLKAVRQDLTKTIGEVDRFLACAELWEMK